MTAETITTAAELKALPGKIVGLEFSDGKSYECGNCDDCCPCCEVGEPRSEGLFVTVKLDDPTARIGAERVTLYRPDRPVAGVLPSVDTVATTIAFNSGPMGTHYYDHALNAARAVLALLPGRTEAEVKAEAIAEAHVALHSLADRLDEFTYDELASALDLPGEWMAAHDAAIKAEALREAAREALASPSTRLGDLNPGEVWARWLRDRADRLEAEARP